MPEQAPQSEAQPEAQGAAPAVQSSGPDKAPFFQIIDHFHQAGDNIAKGIMTAGEATNTAIRSSLRWEDPGNATPPAMSLTEIATTPLMMAGDFVDGTVLNAARRVHEVTESTVRGTRSVYRTVTRPFFHPIDTFTDPVKYLVNPIRVATSAAAIMSETAAGVFRIIDDATNRAVKRVVQRIPIIGTIGGAIGSVAGFITSKVRSVTDAISNKVIHMDNRLAESQA